MTSISQRLAIVATSAVLGLGTINAHPSQAATITYSYLTQRDRPFPFNVSGSFSFDDSLGEPSTRELTDFVMRWEVPEGVFNFGFSDFTSVPKFDQSRVTLVGSWGSAWFRKFSRNSRLVGDREGYFFF